MSAAAALGVNNLHWAQPDQVHVLFMLGVVGGLLPDIDSDSSKPVRAFFSLLAVALAFFVSFSMLDDLQLPMIGLAWVAVFLLVRVGLFEVFSRFTVHRGVWHSWLAAAFTALAVADGAYHLAGFTAWECWLAGLFLALGYLTHLLLDEIASVDLLRNRVKRSFGTALKPFSIASPTASAAMFLAVLALANLTPPIDPVVTMASRLQLDDIPLSFQLGH